MEQKNVTVRDALYETLQILTNLKVPVGLIDEIGVPIKTASNNVAACINALDAITAKAKEEAEKNDGESEPAEPAAE